MRQRFYCKITGIYGICVNYCAEQGKKQNLREKNFFQWKSLCLMQKQHRDQFTEQRWWNRWVHTHGMEGNHRAGCK